MAGTGEEAPYVADEWTRSLRTVLRRSRRTRPDALAELVGEVVRLFERFDRHPSVSPAFVLRIAADGCRDRTGPAADEAATARGGTAVRAERKFGRGSWEAEVVGRPRRSLTRPARWQARGGNDFRRAGVGASMGERGTTDEQESRGAAAEGGAADPAVRTVLLVEDAPESERETVAALARQGVSVTLEFAAASAGVVARRLLAEGRPFHAIAFDLQHDPEGPTTLKRLRTAGYMGRVVALVRAPRRRERRRMAGRRMRRDSRPRRPARRPAGAGILP